MKLRVAITGSSGYLAQQLIARLGSDPDCEYILGLDVRRRVLQVGCEAEFFQFDMTLPYEMLVEFLQKRAINTGLHLAWQFNPIHDLKRHREVDVNGSMNFFRAAFAAGLKHDLFDEDFARSYELNQSISVDWMDFLADTALEDL